MNENIYALDLSFLCVKLDSGDVCITSANQAENYVVHNFPPDLH